MPKALSSSLPTFDRKSEKLSCMEIFSGTTSKLTEIQKVNYIHPLLREDALQVLRILEEFKKYSLHEIMEVFKRCFGDYLPMAKARCEWMLSGLTPKHKKL